MNKASAFLSASLIVLAGCAQAPDKIEAAPVAADTYRGLSCTALAAEATKLASDLSVASKAQEGAQFGDILGVALIGLPLASISGASKAEVIATIKGRQAVLAKAQAGKGCPA